MDYLAVWVLSGRGYVETEGRRYDGATGHLFLLRPHQAHRYGSTREEPWDILWFHAAGEFVGACVRSLRQFGGVRVDLALDPVIQDRWEELVRMQLAGGAWADVRAHTALAAMLGLLLQRLGARLQPRAPGEWPGAAAMQRFILGHYREPLTLAGLAREARLSPTHFARIFKRQFGVSPMYHVGQTRVAAACTLLIESAMPIKQIAAAVGIADPYYFSRLFRRRTGQSPQHYRARRQPPTGKDA